MSRHPNSDKGRPPVPERVRFLRRLNKRDGPVHPKHGKCWVLNRVDGNGPVDCRYSRVAYRVFVGPIPKGKQVLHKCDNEPCVNPKHLFLGTISDNMRDAVSKGRKSGFPNNKHAFGHKQSENAKKTKSLKSAAAWKQSRLDDKPRFKISQTQAEEIRRRYVRTSYLKSNAKELATEYGVGPNQILKIVKGFQHRSLSLGQP